MSPPQLLYLSREEVVSAGPDMKEIIDTLETVFREKDEERTEMPPKPGIHPGGGDNFIHAMPAYIPALKSAGLKWVSGFPENPKKGLPYISGLVILNSVETGLPLAIMDCTWITAMRTGAASALSARFLARPDASIAGVLGCGIQGRTNIEAMNVLFPLKRVMAYDVDPGAVDRFAHEIEQKFDLEVVAATAPKEAVSGCDIIITAGPLLKKPHATILADWMDEGSFATLVDFDSYWHGDALCQADKFCTDDIPQMEHYQQLGYFQKIPPLHGDLGRLVTGRVPGRENSKERTMAANLGLALEDMAVAPLIYNRAIEKQIGTKLSL